MRRKLAGTVAVNLTSQRALACGRLFLSSAEEALHSNETFKADRLAAAADALVQVAEHQQHLQSSSGLKGPYPREALADHLQRVYFRTQQADYFLQLSKDPRAASFPKWARDFYQLAVRGYERNDPIAADENAKCAEEIVKCLEDLAQATSALAPKPPPAVPPPPPPKGPTRQ